MAPEVRFRRLLEAFRNSFPCHAIALLQRDGETLVPRAVLGLNPDTLGRRFTIPDHPRFEQILRNPDPMRFAADSTLPDPYDGLVENTDGHLYVHDCMGATLYIEGQAWGIVTLDALVPATFDTIDADHFRAFVAMAAATVRAADWIQQLENRLQRHHLIQQAPLNRGAPDELVGDSPAIQQLRREMAIVAGSGLPVLILGETGVGKELVARHLHRHSSRAGEPMVHVNCAALPETLAESELFGHRRGAFSGATEDRAGKFELAHEGSLFLDEIGELPVTIQAKLLRALDNGEIQRVGSDRQHQVDVRLITATNRDLEEEVRAGRFRADLYHRLNVYPLRVPPLRERGDDILLLTGYFLERCRRQLGLRGVRTRSGTRRWLTKYSWPGNVRELEHSLSRGIIRALSEGQSRDGIVALSPHHLGAELQTTPTITATDAAAFPRSAILNLSEATEAYRRELVRQRLHEYSGNLAATARSLGLDRGNFHRLLKRLGLRDG
jgi:anaerobic nitric oxide reductase transcription regulator